MPLPQRKTYGAGARSLRKTRARAAARARRAPQNIAAAQQHGAARVVGVMRAHSDTPRERAFAYESARVQKRQRACAMRARQPVNAALCALRHAAPRATFTIFIIYSLLRQRARYV